MKMDKNGFEQDLRKIKKYYGERMSHLCRELFPTLLEQGGLLPDLLLKKFYPSHNLYDDIVKNDLVTEFSNFIYHFLEDKEQKQKNPNQSAKQLLEKVGYKLYECKTQEEILKFKKYYQSGEELCTFSDHRLKNNFVFFAVKNNAKEIKRENFTNPQRQDEYGTSVISIQFTKDESHILSIKNRYNHIVDNPDATFSNDLDNIIPGLTDAFEKDYGIIQKYKSNGFNIPNYVLASDGKYYKYNYEIRNKYYCPDNIIIDNRDVKQYEKEKYLIFDYFILDLVEKNICTYNSFNDGFVSTLQDIYKVDIVKNDYGKKVIIKTKYSKEDIMIQLNHNNKMIAYINNNLINVFHDFLRYDTSIKYLELNNLKYTGNNFLSSNKDLYYLILPNLLRAKSNFLSGNENIQMVILPKLEVVEHRFFSGNNNLEYIALPNLRKAGDYFFFFNNKIDKVYLPKLEEIGSSCFGQNTKIKVIFLPSLQSCDNSFFSSAEILNIVYLPMLENTKSYFCKENQQINFLYTPRLKKIYGYFLPHNKKINTMYMPNIEEFGIDILKENNIFNEKEGDFENYDNADEYISTVKRKIKSKSAESIGE